MLKTTLSGNSPRQNVSKDTEMRCELHPVAVASADEAGAAVMAHEPPARQVASCTWASEEEIWNFAMGCTCTSLDFDEDAPPEDVNDVTTADLPPANQPVATGPGTRHNAWLDEYVVDGERWAGGVARDGR